jgi:hypothetical protein
VFQAILILLQMCLTKLCEAIDDCNPITFVPTDVSSGEDISASLLNGIKDSFK